MKHSENYQLQDEVWKHAQEFLHRLTTDYSVRLYDADLAEIRRWMHNAIYNEGTAVFAFVPQVATVQWFHLHISSPGSMHTIKGRLELEKSKNTAPYPAPTVTFSTKALSRRNASA